MAKTISKTFRLPPEVAREIEEEATKRNIPQGQYFAAVVIEHKALKLQKEFEENLTRMEKDEDYQREQYELAEADFS